MNTKLLLVAAAFSVFTAMADDTPAIRTNQVGYLPSQEKVIVFDGATPKKIVVNNKVGRTIAKPTISRTAISAFTGKTRAIVDVSSITTPGIYTIEGDGLKGTFEVKSNALRPLSTAAAKAFYLMRSGEPILPQHAGIYARPAAHPDTLVLIHPSAASESRPTGTRISSPWGWYDAGDYNKYIVNSAFTIGLMLAVYQQVPQYFATLDLNIPESGNKTADLLDEIMFNLKWMVTMQDPGDGGVYHKLTTPNFEGFVMPTECHQQRYVVKKTTTATLDFAAVMAQAAKVYEGSADYPAFHDQAIKAAEAAYEWSKAHPSVFYRQDMMNRSFEPKVNTGTYDDMSAKDEWFWAATQLYLATGKASYLEDARQNAPEKFDIPVWGNLSGLGLYAWLSSPTSDLRDKALTLVGDFARKAHERVGTSCFQSPFGDQASDFGWGCLAEGFCSPAVALLFADKYIEKGAYRADAQRTLDYILGRNPLGYCYVTGFGKKSPMHPHQRISSADGIVSPMPGLLVGGPNPGQQDKGSGLTYPSNAPDESYLDEEGSYASNEIAINWNASLVALVAWLDAW